MKLKKEKKSSAANTDSDASQPRAYDGSIGSSDQIESPENNVEQFDMHDDHERQRAMVGALLKGTFDENIRTHAENLAEKLIQRQQELDRREAQLNRRSAEIENDLRQSRLNVQLVPHSKHMTAINEPHMTVQTFDHRNAAAAQASTTDEVAAETIDAEPSPVEELLANRIDKFCKAQRQPYSRINARMKKYSGGKKADRDADAEADSIAQADSTGTILFDGQLNPIVSQVAMADPVLLSINQLTDSATVIRRRSEEIDAMYEKLTDIFSEMLRQQGAMRELTSSLSEIKTIEHTGEIKSVHNELNRLTIQLTMVGRDHFLLPLENVDVA